MRRCRRPVFPAPHPLHLFFCGGARRWNLATACLPNAASSSFLRPIILINEKTRGRGFGEEERRRGLGRRRGCILGGQTRAHKEKEPRDKPQSTMARTLFATHVLAGTRGPRNTGPALEMKEKYSCVTSKKKRRPQKSH
jgi:hypothetical protein